MKRQQYIRIRSIIAGQDGIEELSPPFALPQGSKFFVSLKKHFLIGKDSSYLKFILPNMDYEMGGGCG